MVACFGSSFSPYIAWHPEAILGGGLKGLSPPPYRPRLQIKIRLFLTFAQQSFDFFCAFGAISWTSPPYDIFLGPRLVTSDMPAWCNKGLCCLLGGWLIQTGGQKQCKILHTFNSVKLGLLAHSQEHLFIYNPVQYYHRPIPTNFLIHTFACD